MTYVHLTDAELSILDGRCSPKVQAEVDAAKARLMSRRELDHLTESQAGFIADVVTRAQKVGRLTWQGMSLRSCDICGWGGEFYPFKSGPRKGRPNRKRPIQRAGIDLGRGFIIMSGRATLGGCKSCIETLLPDLRAALVDVRAELPDPLHTEGQPRYRRHTKRECTKCGWQGHEGQLRMLPAVISGQYPGGCPQCEAENTLFTTVIKSLDEWVVVEAGAS